MKNYVIATLAVGLLLLGSIIYRKDNTVMLRHFPKPDVSTVSDKGAPPLFLYYFFSRRDCSTCLTHAVAALNSLKPPYYPIGVAPADELAKEEELRQFSGARFPLTPLGGFKRFYPGLTPALFGVSASGRVLFVTPTFQEWEIDYNLYLSALYGKYYTLLQSDFQAAAR